MISSRTRVCPSSSSGWTGANKTCPQRRDVGASIGRVCVQSVHNLHMIYARSRRQKSIGRENITLHVVHARVAAGVSAVYATYRRKKATDTAIIQPSILYFRSPATVPFRVYTSTYRFAVHDKRHSHGDVERSLREPTFSFG